MKKEERTIPVNIWDDFYDDEHVPSGEIQKTYIYIEDTDLSFEYRERCLKKILKFINKNIKFNGVTFKMGTFDSWKEYPELVGTEHEHMMFRRPEIKIENLTHKDLDALLCSLQSCTLRVDGICFEFYSES